MHKSPSRLCTLYIFLLSTLSASSLQADEFIEWQSANIQFLRGWDYEAGKEQRNIITTEYANRWRYGDVFIFIDGTRFDGGETSIFGEISPRFSFTKITGKQYSYGIIKDVLIATNLEKGQNNVNAYLLGIGLDLDLPGFAFFSSNIYLRDNPNLAKDTWQITLSWKYPLQIRGTKLIAEGFTDIAGDAGSTYKYNQLIVPRFLVDISSLVGTKKPQLWAGIEYSYWNNKLGINGVKESHPQLQIKWIF